MPSDALNAWQKERLPRLKTVETDCLHLEALHAGDANRVQEFIRSYAVLLSAEFQGFCRDLHNECAEKLVESIKPLALQAVLRSQCRHRRKLDTGNPNPDNLGDDFKRYQLELWPTLVGADPSIAERKQRLVMLNTWRNAIAHHDFDSGKLGESKLLTIPQVGNWLIDCDALAIAFDRVVTKHLQKTTDVVPWSP